MKKRKLKKFDVVAAVKSNARDRVGQPKPGQIIQDKRKRIKHKKQEEA